MAGARSRGCSSSRSRHGIPKTKKYLQDVRERRFILVTDLESWSRRTRTSRATSSCRPWHPRVPMAGATVQILTRNGVPALTGTTGTDGRVSFGAIGKVPKEMEPIAIVARNGQDVAFIPYNRDDRQVDFSRFDVGGANVLSGRDLNAFVFTERGVYRPGDVMHAGFSVKTGKLERRPDRAPPRDGGLDARNAKAQSNGSICPPGVSGNSPIRLLCVPHRDYNINIYLVKDGKTRRFDRLDQRGG